MKLEYIEDAAQRLGNHPHIDTAFQEWLKVVQSWGHDLAETDIWNLETFKELMFANPKFAQ
jgi:hypothetical protein